ncbi:MAG: zinc ribbon domain-containing protein [Treponema sp.]|nr:zinc ribbon domain-containing protein [Treponema sp.]
MAFCSKCGKELVEGAQFCSGCGTPVGGAAVAENDGSKRAQKFEGEIRKCPACGAVLEAFQAVCPSCGFELRGSTKVASSVEKLMEKILELENNREEISKDDYYTTSKTDLGIANLIKVFPVPNTIEEILEFVMIASTSINPKLLFSNGIKKTDMRTGDENGQMAISAAWRSKMEQMYKKAEMSFGSSPKFQEVKKIYDEIQAKIKQAKIKNLIFNPFFILVVVVIVGVIMAAINS